MSDTILKAYCVESNAIVDIEEAREAYFEQAEPRDRLNFLCSAETCRAMPKPPSITGVNYDKEDYKRTPHFKRHKDHIHAESCYWGQYNSILNEILQDKNQRKKCIEKGGKNLFRDFKNFDPAEIYDEFHLVPKQEKQTQQEHSTLTEEINTPKAIKHRIIHEHKKTRSFSNLIDMFRDLDDKQKITAMLTLPELPRELFNESDKPYSKTPRTSYENAFKPVCYIKHFFEWTHVYYGKAKIC